MSVMAETSQSAMGPYVAIAAVGLVLYAWTAIFRVALVMKVVGLGGGVLGDGGGVGGFSGFGGGGEGGLSKTGGGGEGGGGEGCGDGAGEGKGGGGGGIQSRAGHSALQSSWPGCLNTSLY